MTPRTAVILAAGMGTRLGSIGREMPKGFLRCGDRPIIEESIDHLTHAGVERIVIVTGHLREFYDELANRSGAHITTIHNPAYAASGSLYSVAAIGGHVDEDILLLESDLIYEPSALEAVHGGSGENIILLSDVTDTGDDVFVETYGGCLSAMSKDRNLLSGVAGVMVGISRVSRALLQAMTAFAAEHRADRPQATYETDGFVGQAARHSIRCPVLPGLLWSEIDDTDHFERAAAVIYPAIQSATLAYRIR